MGFSNPLPAVGMAQQRRVKDDQDTATMRMQPWYITQMQQWGMDPNNPSNLAKSQQSQLLTLAQQHGLALGDTQIDDTGRINDAGHYLRNGLIAASAFGGAAAVPFALGGAGAAAGGAAADGSVLPSTTIGTGMVPAVGGTGSGAVDAALGGAGAAAGGAAAIPDWLKSILKLAPAAALIPGVTGSGSSGGVGTPGPFDDQIKQLLGLQINRVQSEQPVHEAAMRLAMSMAPTSQSSPRMDAAIQQSGMPSPTTPQNPQVLAAIQKLMQGGG